MQIRKLENNGLEENSSKLVVKITPDDLREIKNAISKITVQWGSLPQRTAETNCR